MGKEDGCSKSGFEVNQGVVNPGIIVFSVVMSGYIFPVLYITFGLYTFTLTLLSLRIYCYLHVPVIILRTHFH